MDTETFVANLLTALKNKEIRESLGDIVSQNVKNEIVLLRKELKQKDQLITQLQSRVDSLESEYDALEQYTRRNSLRLHGLPEQHGEDTATRAVTFINETMKVEPPITMEDLDRVHRISTKKKSPTPSASNATHSSTDDSKPRPIIIKFATYRARHRVITRKKNLQGTKIFINEDLTRARSTMLYKARLMKKQGCITDVWTHDGAIVFKDNNNTIKSARSLLQCDELMESFAKRPH